MDQSKAGFVYVLQMEGHPYFKIGRTNNLTRRLGQISPVLPTDLSLRLALRVGDSSWAESRLHLEFKDRRLKGEWFLLDDDCLELVKICLMFCQSDSLLRRVTEAFVNEEPGRMCLFRQEQYGRVIALAARRTNRRLRHIAQYKRIVLKPNDEHILSAELIA